MQGVELGRVVEAEKEDTSEAVPGAHEPVSTAPTDTRVPDEGTCDERSKRAGESAGTIETYMWSCIVSAAFIFREKVMKYV